MTHVDLFSGIGGFALAARWAGLQTVAFCEIDKFCQAVLRKNFPGVPIYDDIKTFADTGCERQKISEKQTTGVKQYIKTPFLLTGGFPCQPFSCAGKRKGTADDRHLWPHMLRVIKTLNPRWVIAENVGGLVNIKNVVEPGGDAYLEDETDSGGEDNISTSTLICILDDLEQAGYSVQVFLIPACAVGAPHRRDRIWIVAHAEGNGSGGITGKICQADGRQNSELCFGVEDADRHAPHSEHNKTSRHGQNSRGVLPITEPIRPDNCNQWEQDWYSVAVRTCVRGIPNGFSNWLDRSGIKLEVTNYAKTIKTITRQNMPGLRKSIQQESVWETVRGFDEVSVQEVLFAVLRQCGRNPDEICLSASRKEDAENPVRGVRNDGESSYSSQGRGCNEQHTDEYPDLMCELSSQISLATVESYKTYKTVPSNRVNRLKALGNSIVPQIPYLIMKAILETEQ